MDCAVGDLGNPWPTGPLHATPRRITFTEPE
jgi:hypothetical protein